MSQDVRDMLELIVADVEADPYLGQRIAARKERPRRVRLVAVASVLVLAVLVLAVLVVAPWRSDTYVLTPAMPPTVTGPDEAVLLDGPVGPPVPGTREPAVVLGRAYPIAPERQDGQELIRVIFAIPPDQAFANNHPYAYCLALWRDGTPLREARIESCPRGASGPGPTPAVFVGENNTEANTAVYGPAALTTVLRRDVVRAEIKLALTSDLPATATPDGGHPPVRKRLPVRIYGSGDPRMPYLLGVFDAVPKGYTTIGTDAWNARGQQVVTNSQGAGPANLHGWYCGPDPQRPTAPYEPCPG